MAKKQIIPNETELWNKIRSGHKFALEELYNTYAQVLYNYGNRLFHNPYLIEDAIHDVFVDLWRLHKNLGEVKSVRLYLFASLRRRVVKQIQRSPLINYEYAGIPEVPSRENVLIENEIQDEQIRRLQANLAHLSPRQYEAIMLRYFDNLSYAEIAKVLEVNEQSVRNLIQRGLEQLRHFSKIVFTLIFFVFI